jgi:hypothetical protein
MWVMTWTPERAGNGTKNQVLYDSYETLLSVLPPDLGPVFEKKCSSRKSHKNRPL